jgi:hypothetical protein
MHDLALSGSRRGVLAREPRRCCASRIGITVPQSVLNYADRVIR